MFALLLRWPKVITNPICDERLWLFVNNASVKIMSFKEVRSSCTKRRPQVGWSICHCIRLLRAFASFSFGLTILAANEKSKAAFG